MGASPANNLPLDSRQTTQLHTAVDGLSAQQLQWVSGYVAGLAASGAPTNALPAEAESALAEAPPSRSLTILYGSQTGNGEEVAGALARRAEQDGITAQSISLADYKPAALKRESVVTFVVSTHGEGDPPDDAELFREFLLSKKAPQLSGLNFSVLALGDSSYANFCQTGREFDARLAELGAQRFDALTECDLDYNDTVAEWLSRTTQKTQGLLAATPATGVAHLHAVAGVPAGDKAVYGKANPFAAEVLTNQKITGARSSKDVRHLELSLQGSGLSYEAGDSLAVLVRNPPQLVDELIEALALPSDAAVTLAGDDNSSSLLEALSSRLEITAMTLGFLQQWSELTEATPLQEMLDCDDRDALSAFLDSHQIIDVVRQYPAAPDAQQFVGLLRKLAPRSYSISSSAAANPDEVHITVAAVRYNAFDRDHWGAASTHLADRIAEGDTVQVYVEKNKRFRPPQADVAAIMIGPGTGVAPFRAFLEERDATQASGKNWLFFGERNFASDFLYQLEWQRYLKQGALTKLSVAFSRDQREKIYVQDRIRENAAELYRWLQDGAAIYVCGDAKRMAPDVQEALIEVIAKQGKKSYDEAAQDLKQLRVAGRYQRDVY